MARKTPRSQAEVSFDVSPWEREKIGEIVERAMETAERRGTKIFDRMSLMMDIAACHCNGCPLRLLDLLHADDANFAHDVLGIHYNMDRNTGQLENLFLPRFANTKSDSFASEDVLPVEPVSSPVGKAETSHV